MKKVGITQRLSNRLRRRGNVQQHIAAWEGRVRAWGQRDQGREHDVAAAGAAVDDVPAAEPTDATQRRRGALPRIRRPERSLEQLYDAVDHAHVGWLDQFHKFLDAKDVLLEARQAVHDDDEPIPGAVARVVAVQPTSVGVPDAGVDADEWDEDALGGAWEGGSNGQVS